MGGVETGQNPSQARQHIEEEDKPGPDSERIQLRASGAEPGAAAQAAQNGKVAPMKMLEHVYRARDSLGVTHALEGVPDLQAAQRAADALDRKLQRIYPMSKVRIVELVE